ncbi:hypothetical protein ACFYS7_38635 [Streptomyces avermitilis]|uniref:hypothetical protein n=1 Tax=Streptomyces avermitilis TaxID=33903 RepID=UPI0036A3161E
MPTPRLPRAHAPQRGRARNQLERTAVLYIATGSEWPKTRLLVKEVMMPLLPERSVRTSGFDRSSTLESANSRAFDRAMSKVRAASAAGSSGAWSTSAPRDVGEPGGPWLEKILHAVGAEVVRHGGNHKFYGRFKRVAARPKPPRAGAEPGRCSCALCGFASRRDLLLSVGRRPQLADLYAEVKQERGDSFRADWSITD